MLAVYGGAAIAFGELHGYARGRTAERTWRRRLEASLAEHDKRRDELDDEAIAAFRAEHRRPCLADLEDLVMPPAIRPDPARRAPGAPPTGHPARLYWWRCPVPGCSHRDIASHADQCPTHLERLTVELDPDVIDLRDGA